MTEKKKVSLSLAVREKLMRGLYDEAVDLTMIEYKVEKDIAERLIEKYREELRERKQELEILKMQRESELEEAAERQKYYRYGAWAVGVAVLLALVWLFFKGLSK